MFAAFRIVADVLVYRLRKLEMANLAAATSIGLALHLRLADVAVRTFFALLLNVLVYLNNDYVDAELDLRSTDKDSAKTKFLNDHMGAALFAQWGLVGLLVLFSILYDIGMLAPIVLGGGICVWYSAYLKRRPYFDVPSMMLWGLAMPACGFPWQSTLGWCLAILLGLFSGVFEAIQVMRDADEDAAEGVRTTGVALGQKKTLLLARALMVVSTAFAVLVIHPIAGVISAVALVIPFTPDRIARYWTLVKMNYGVTWLFICAWIFFAAHSSGLVWAIGVR